MQQGGAPLTCAGIAGRRTQRGPRRGYQPGAPRREQRGRSARDGGGRGATDGEYAHAKRYTDAEPGDAGAVVPRAGAGEGGGGDY